MKWFSENPHGPNPGFRGKMGWGSHQFGRNMFPSAFARGGAFTTTAFAPTVGEAFKAPWRRTVKTGSAEHINNLQRMLAENPDNSKRINKAIEKAKMGSGKAGSAALAGRIGIGAAFVAMPAFLTPGSGIEKARATAGAAAGQIGWSLGSRLGMGAGAAIGTAILPGVGTVIGEAIGAIAGAFVGEYAFNEGFQALSRVPDRMVERERARRNLNWQGDTTAFMTQNAHTMRQQSLQAMNRGQMTARSMLGREGVMLHQ